MKKVALIGSMRYYYKMAEIERQLILNGYLPLTPTPVFGYDNKGVFNKQNEQSTIMDDQLKEKLNKLHLEKITLADIVLVCNFDDYIGESMFSEFCYAYHLTTFGMEKKLCFLQDNTGNLTKEYLGSFPVYTYTRDLKSELGIK